MADTQPIEAQAGKGLWAKIRGWLDRGVAREDQGPTSPRGVAAGAEVTLSPLGNPLMAKEGYVGNFQMNSESSFDANSPVAHALQLSDDLLQRYRDVEDMDDYPETSAIMTLYADDATIPDSQSGRTIWASSNDKLVRDVLEDLLTRRLRIEDDVHGLARTLGKYGNRFAEVLVGKQGVVGLNYLGAPTVRRVQDIYGATLGYVQDPTGQFVTITQSDFNDAIAVPRDQRKPVQGCVIFEPWEVIHWRLRQKDQNAVYGTSVLDGARWAWKRLTMMEDTALVTKMTRGPSRLAFYIDTGDLPPAESLAHVNKIKQQYSRKKVFNPTTGQIDFRYNVQCLTGDTRVRLIDGTERTLVEMGEAHDRGEQQWVHAVDVDRQIRHVPGKVVWAGKTRSDAELVKVTLDNGESIRLTPDHKCIREDGEPALAGDLVVGDALLPLHRIRTTVVQVERLVEREDTYTLTVEGVHTFGLSAGIYVHNSNLEDLWLGSRGGKDSTRVDVLQGVDNQDLDILEYFRGKVLSAALVPKRLLGMDENQGRVASGDDVRFARSAMRLQREVKNGVKQVCRIHLAALGIDPDAVKFDLHMTVPSYIFELAQLEVRLQQAQLAQGLGEMVPAPWILQHVFGFSQDEAIYVTDAARADQKTQAKLQAQTQAEIMSEYPEVAGVQPEAPPQDQGAAGEGGATESTDDASVKRRLDRILAENARVTRLTERMASRVDEIDRALERREQHEARARRAAGGYKRG